MSYYKYHVFFCTNQRSDGGKCCEEAGASELRAYAKQKIKALNMSGRGQVRINASGCLDRCGLGPVIVVYPGEVWYRYDSKQDVDEILQQHIIKGQRVSRLMLEP